MFMRHLFIRIGKKCIFHYRTIFVDAKKHGRQYSAVVSKKENMTIDKLFTFGVIADVQHANVDNRMNHHKTQTRYYRAAIEHLKDAILTWNEKKVDFVVQLGDIIDGISRRQGHRDNDIKNLIDVLKRFKSTGLPIYKNDEGVYEMIKKGHDSEKEKVPYICNLWGNHEFYNFSREWLWNSPLNTFINHSNTDVLKAGNSIKDIEEKHGYYYSFVYHGYRVIALDSYDLSTIARPGATVMYVKAMSFLKSINRNSDLNEPPCNNANIVAWNGGLSNTQLSWLHNELAVATTNKEKVIILSHISIHPRAAHKTALLWNHKEVLAMINAFDCVVACFTGHDHDGGYYHDTVNNIHHVTFEGAIERPADTNAYGVVNVYEDRLEIEGYGVVKNRVLRFC